jgi:hypothetical protein
MSGKNGAGKDNKEYDAVDKDDPGNSEIVTELSGKTGTDKDSTEYDAGDKDDSGNIF